MTNTHRDEQFEREALGCLPDVSRFAYSLTRNQDTADDLVQETYLSAYRGYLTFREGNSVKRWLFSICHHAWLRTAKRDRRVVLTEEGAEAELETLAAVMGHVAAQQSGVEAFVGLVDVGPAIHVAIDALAPAFRAVVELVDVQEFSYHEAATVLGVPVGTVRSRLFRARRLLQEQLLAHAYDAGMRINSPTATNDHNDTETSLRGSR
ncbi:MAG: RNA polymerase sigma factor [Gemmatimonadaceae bacterium]|nr:RNA polymerase sigma factor [Gemmatimonadaceae bacterium]